MPMLNGQIEFPHSLTLHVYQLDERCQTNHYLRKLYLSFTCNLDSFESCLSRFTKTVSARFFVIHFENFYSFWYDQT